MKKTRVLQVALAALLVAGCSAPMRPTLAPHFAGTCRSARPVRTQSAPVRWSGPADARNKTRLDSWCAAVGPVLFQGGIARDEPSLDDVTFVSWNVHVGSADVDGFVRDLRSGLLSGGRRPRQTVLMLQEAVRSDGVPRLIPMGASAAGWIGPAGNVDGGRSEIDQLAQKLDMSVFYAPSMRNGTASAQHVPADRGNAILSSLPLSDPVAIELPGERQRRVAVTARIWVKGDHQRMPLTIGAAHLDTLGGPRTLWLLGAAATRAAQAKSLMAAVPGGPLILGADLNSWLGPREPAARDLLRLFPSTPAGPREPTFRAGLLLDYMFFRPPPGWHAHIERAPERYGSDHYPLIGWLELEP